MTAVPRVNRIGLCAGANGFAGTTQSVLVAYTLADDERLLADTVQAFAKTQGLEAASDRDRRDRYPVEAMKEAAGLGLLGLASTSSGASLTHLVLALDAVATVDPALGSCIAAHNAALHLAADHDVAEAMAQGEVAALAYTEEATGADAARTGTKAVPDGNGWRLTGQKVWTINAEVAEHLMVLAQTPKGPAWFAVPGNAEGLARGANEPIMGLRSSGIRTLYLSQLKVEASRMVLGPESALAGLERARGVLRLASAALHAGAVAGALDAAARFAETRVQFGKPIGTYQAVSDGVSEMDIQLHAARSLNLAAAARSGEPDFPVWAARAKAFATTMAIPMTRQAIRVQGGTGFMREGGTERFARDVRALQFVGDPVPLQKDVVKRAVMPALEFPADP